MGNSSKYNQAISLHFVHVSTSFYNIPCLQTMAYFLRLLILLSALFTTIIAPPTSFTSFDDMPNSWLAESLPNNANETPLAGTFTGESTDPLRLPDSPATSPEQNKTPIMPPLEWPPETMQLPSTPQIDWTRPMFLCCTHPWNNDEDDQKTCIISLEYIHWPL